MRARELKKEVEKYIKRNYGKRCEFLNLKCHTCIAWCCYDLLFCTLEKEKYKYIGGKKEKITYSKKDRDIIKSIKKRGLILK